MSNCTCGHGTGDFDSISNDLARAGLEERLAALEDQLEGRAVIGTGDSVRMPDAGNEAIFEPYGFQAEVQARMAEIEATMPKFEFQAWPATKRLYREVVVTEKLDGSNVAIQFDGDGNIAAQSRKRLIEPGDDNFGFAGFAYANKEKLFEILGIGIHFGEWYGRKIQRTYGLDHRRFALFNIAKWGDILAEPLEFEDGTLLTTPPVLYRGTFSDDAVLGALHGLRDNGSVAAPGFTKPEGVCVFHTQTRGVFKVTLDGEDRSKFEQ